MRLPKIVVAALELRMQSLAAKRAPDFLIGGEEQPYVRRWWIIPRNRLANMYLHHFCRSDDDRALHDHPWWNVSILLRGAYTEHTIAAGGINRRIRYSVGAIKIRGAKNAHRIELTDGECWTLFLTGPVLRSWGFHCPHGWRHWRDFVDQRDHGSVGRGCGE